MVHHRKYPLTKASARFEVATSECLGEDVFIVGNPNRKKMHILGFVGIFEYIC